MTEDAEAETLLVYRALCALWEEDDMWARNRDVFSDMNRRERIWWWRMAKQQAAAGAPAMQTLLNKFIELRLTS